MMLLGKLVVVLEVVVVDVCFMCVLHIACMRLCSICIKVTLAS